MSEAPMNMQDDSVLALDNQFCFALYAANRAVTARYRPLLHKLGLTYPQYLVMLVLWEAEAGQGRDGVPVSELGRRLRLDSGTLTPLLKRLAERGLVSRNRSVRDERVVEVRPTDEGNALREQARSVPGDMLCGTGIELEKLMALRDQLRALVSQLEVPGEPSD